VLAQAIKKQWHVQPALLATQTDSATLFRFLFLWTFLLISLRQLHLQRGHKILLENTDLTIYPGWKVGITGANGCGKSSLFALLRGQLHLDQGSLDFPSQWTIAHVAQETPALPQAALEYVLDGDVELRRVELALQAAQTQHDGLHEAELHAQLEHIGGYSARARAGELLHGLGFTEAQQNRPVASFSGGWRMRLNLAQALMCRSDLLLLDEPTNHLDLDALLWFEQWLKGYSGTLLLISHDRDFLDNVVAHIAHFEQQNIKLYTGNYAAFERQRAAQLALQQASYSKQQRQISHLQQFVDRFRAKASKAKQAQSRLKALEKMELISAAHLDSPFAFAFAPPQSCPNPLLNLKDVSLGYGDTRILSNVQLCLVPEMRIGLLGPNGAGKSTLIKALAGELQAQSGTLESAQGLRIGYFAQHQLEHLHPDWSALAHVQHLDKQATEQSLRDFLGGFGFPGERALDKVAPFSGGEKARLALALLVYQKPNLLLLDEPTNHLDLNMRHALNVALQDYQGALIVVSHDRHLLRSTTDQLILVAQGQVTPFDGDLEAYRDWLLNAAKTGAATQDKAEASQRKQQKQQDRTQKRQLESKVKKLEQQIDKIQAEKQRLDTRLADPALYADREKVKQHQQDQQKLSAELADLEEQWLAWHEALENL